MVPSALPDGDAAPLDAALPASATTAVGSRGLGVYVHVPFCAARCGYCDFNTYVGRSTDGFAAAVGAEIRMAREQLGPRPFSTVFL